MEKSRTGRYAHLGNAWATVFSAARARKQKHDRRASGFEIYRQAPAAGIPAGASEDSLTGNDQDAIT